MSKIDLTAESADLAADFDRHIRRLIDERIGNAITSRGRVNANAVEGSIPPRNGGTGTNQGLRPHPIDTHTNVAITDPQDGDILVYFALDQMWRNVAIDLASTPGALTVAGDGLTIGGDTLTLGG
jgi:hypothetical protein